MSQDLEKLLQEAPSLTLDPFAQQESVPAVAEPKQPEGAQEKSAAQLEREKLQSVLSEEEKKQVDAFVSQIDITNSQMVLQSWAMCAPRIWGRSAKS
mgnify:CR=1 FL=1